jgi:hypothetical protein
MCRLHLSTIGHDKLKGLLARHLFTTLAPSIMNTGVVPVSPMAWMEAIVIVFKYSCKGLPNRERAAIVYAGPTHVQSVCSLGDRLDAATVTLSPLQLRVMSTNLVGFKELSYAETKLLNVFAKWYVFSAPPCQNDAFGRTVLCIPLVQQP